MAKAFGDSAGGAISNKIDYFKLKDGENRFRMVGGILPRYVYWLKTTDDKAVAMECLAFNRDAERFDNAEVDNVQKLFPKEKCSWSYVIKVIDVEDGNKVKVLALKKKLLQQIMDAADDLGDPTNLDTGWDCVVKRAKTGPLAYNVEYTLLQLKLKPAPVSDEIKAAVSEDKTIDELFPRQTPDEQLKFLNSRIVGDGAGEDNKEEMNEFNDDKSADGFDDDIPF